MWRCCARLGGVSAQVWSRHGSNDCRTAAILGRDEAGAFCEANGESASQAVRRGEEGALRRGAGHMSPIAPPRRRARAGGSRTPRPPVAWTAWPDAWRSIACLLYPRTRPACSLPPLVLPSKAPIPPPAANTCVRSASALATIARPTAPPSPHARPGSACLACQCLSTPPSHPPPSPAIPFGLSDACRLPFALLHALLHPPSPFRDQPRPYDCASFPRRLRRSVLLAITAARSSWTPAHSSTQTTLLGLRPDSSQNTAHIPRHAQQPPRQPRPGPALPLRRVRRACDTTRPRRGHGHNTRPA